MTDRLTIPPIHPFPARMAPSIVWKYIPDSNRRLKVLDPMMGSGTTLVSVRSKGHIALGFDIDPLARLIAEVWCTDVDIERVRRKANEVLERSRNRNKAICVANSYPANADDKLRDFITYWFDPVSRKQLASLAVSISKIRNLDEKNILWCAFSRLIITKQSGASLAMDVSHSRPHKKYETSPVKPFDKFLASVEYVTKRIPFRRESRPRLPLPKIKGGDARNLQLKGASVDLIITSPPYLNAIDYLRGHRLALVWMGYSLSEIRNLRSGSIGSEISREPVSSCVSNAMKESGKVELLAPRHRGMLANYLNDMQKSILEMKRVIKPGGQVVLVIGNSSIRGLFIDNSKSLEYLSKQSGFCLVDREIRHLPERHRYLPAPTNQSSGARMQKRMKEEVILIFRSPKQEGKS